MDTVKIGINVLPVAVNLVSYGLVLKSYMKYVHNTAFDYGPQAIPLKDQKFARARSLKLFIFVGAPLLVLGLKSLLIGFNDVLSIDVNTPKDNTTKDINPAMSFYGLFMNKIPG